MLVSKAVDKGITLEIHTDEDPQNPRQEFECLASMVCWHRNYNLGDKHSFDDPEAFYDHVKRNNSVFMPLYLFDHSGLSISCDPSMFRAFDSQQWDWGQVGFIYLEKERIRKEYSVKRISPALLAKVKSYMEQEVKTYDQYLSGEVYGFVLQGPDIDNDSCWGFYGDDFHKNGMADYLGSHTYLLDKLEPQC